MIKLIEINNKLIIYKPLKTLRCTYENKHFWYREYETDDIMCFLETCRKKNINKKDYTGGFISLLNNYIDYPNNRVVMWK